MTQTNKKMAIKRRKPDPVDIIELAHSTNGIIIDAHPFLIEPEPEKLYRYLERLLDAGLDGIEARYTYDKCNYKGNETNEQLEHRIKEKYGNTGMFMSGGSDYHGEWRKGAANPREMGEKGLTIAEYRGSIVALINKSKF
jgi:predicted metal-dependent phosphoesterase TrpH